ncbi:serine hydrolase domain-containing protein [Paenibacillus xylaniclasticus]|uniref:serine hydrolase domain-containing protein n=1 Tax=Paenibacillus xylaniclasticus TaxID=588083 RepID=UPI000FDC9F07|nr:MULTISPECIES: serine hydrolase [Paenibacillus]GFN31763.1 6-aminohexanoate-dimer hydrolase [Paenibacillus curdlanolyticus]
MLIQTSNNTEREDAMLPRQSAKEAGLEYKRLDRMRQQLPALGMKSVVLVSNGSLVWEWHEHGEDRPLSLYSCTKSVISLLIGIAIGQGLLSGMEERAAEWLEPLRRSADSRKRELTIGHMLTMTAGFDWQDFDKPYWAMKRTNDWVAFAADRPIIHEPGKVFCYNSGCSHMLSAVLTAAAGKSAMSFASEHLFGPLGIKRAAWSSRNGINDGGTGLHLSSRDMAKLGLLCLQQGRMAGEQLVPADWLDITTKPYHKALSHYEPHIYGCYGGHWWVDEGDGASGPFYFAFGYGGQYLIVAPKLQAVAVIRKKPAGRNQAIISRDLFHYVLVPSLPR